MQDHPIVGCPDDTLSVELKRRLSLELVSAPPADGDDLDYLARAVGEPSSSVEAAVASLVTDGLAQCGGGRVRASTAAQRFEGLWPIRP
jgi:hypothetical protein